MIQTLYEKQLGATLQVRIKNVSPIPTVFIRRLADGAECWINEEDFDADIHEIVEAPPLTPKLRVPREQLQAPEVELTRQNLALMTIDQLKLTPQFASLPRREVLNDKESIVTAILVAAGKEEAKVDVRAKEAELKEAAKAKRKKASRKKSSKGAPRPKLTKRSGD